MNETKGKLAKFIFWVLALSVSGLTLGFGLAIGYVVVQNFVPEPEIPIVEATHDPITTVRVEPFAIPIDIAGPDFAEIIPEIKKAVVSVNVSVARGFGRGEAPGSGSGFIFAEDEDFVFIATNNHVIYGVESVTISLDDEQNVPAIIIGGDRESDLAVLAVLKSDLYELEKDFAIAVFGDSSQMRIGDSVVAIGNAMGGGQTVTRGIISVLDLNITISEPVDGRYSLSLDVLQTDAAVNRGNSGGPLVNGNGEVIGVVTAKLLGADIEGMGYALPSNDVLPIIMNLKELGSIRQPFIGIEHLPISENMAFWYNLPSSGLLVRAVGDGTPAYESGIMIDDLIYSMNGRLITSFDEFRVILSDSRPGDTAILGIFRGNERIEVSIILGSVVR